MTASPRTLIVGDVHGCADELRDLLRTAGWARGDEVVLTGDLCGKGPDTRGVLALVRELGARAVLGNHDDALLQWHLAVRAGREPPPTSGKKVALARALAPEDWEVLEALTLVHPLPAHGSIVVHAGLVPGVALERQPREMLLTMRSLRADGTPSPRIEDGVPWAARWPGPEHVYFGHDAVRGLQQHPHATGLDTGCVYGGELTACDLETRRLIAVPARRQWAEP